MRLRTPLILVLAAILPRESSAAEQSAYASHAPSRTAVPVSTRPLGKGPAMFVDAARGDDAGSGAENAPWKTLTHALRQLKPGDTLYLRGGVYYERPALSRSGTAEAPITIRGYPGETAVIDGGLSEFFDSPATSWQPADGGAEGEFVSTKTYPDSDARRVPQHFIPAAWEPMWGAEEQRPLALGNFGDSMIPLHSYRTVEDLRATNEFWPGSKKETAPVYCGPGLWFNRETGRVHIRLAHNTLPGLGDRAYRGETDPRKLPLVVALGFGDDVLRISGIRHVTIQDLTLRGATGSPLMHVYGSEGIKLDRITAFGGFPTLLVNASKDLQLTNSAFRGLAAPWSGRSHMKYRGTAAYQIVLQNNQPVNENIEIANCEFTDDHDFAFFRFAKNLRFHHNYVDNFNDDGIEYGPKLRDHTIYIYQNHIGACLGTFTQHEIEKDESPIDHDSAAGVFVYRNVIDQRAGVPYHLPGEAEPSGEFLHHEGHLVGDHGGPIWPVTRFYHNTLLRRTPIFRDNYLFGLGVLGLRNSERDVFNNLFLEMERVPGVKFVALNDGAKLREGGNILWGYKDGPALTADPFEKFRASPLFAKSKQVYEPGWTTNDRVVDPKLAGTPTDPNVKFDLRPAAGSPAIKSGESLPSEWPDVVKSPAGAKPDVGAVPHGAELERIGIGGRMSILGN